jgi:hypothetical protein
MSYPKRYVPSRLTKKDKKKQKKEINKSRKAYKKGKYYTRKKVKSFKSKESAHVVKAKKIYGVKNISANSKLAKKTGCSINALRKIIKKGQGAYYSSGSRPNQTGHSWGRARLASSITGGKAAAVDFNILESGCKAGSKALRLAKSARKRHGHGTRRVPKHKGGGKIKTRKNRSTKMHEKILKFERGPGEKKYTAHIKDNKTGKVRVLHFGHKDYEQYKDRTKNGLYSSRNHGNKKRQRNYYNRHSGEKNRKKAIEKEKRKGNGYYTPKLLSHIYLW